jgi:hypothetical protein
MKRMAPARPGHAESEEQESGKRRGKRHDDHHRRQQFVGSTLGAQPAEQRHDQGRRDRDSRAVRLGDDERQRAPRREGQAIGDRDGAGD